MTFHGTTAVAVTREGATALAADGQVSLGDQTIFKHHARKIRRIGQGEVLAGFAGSVADALTLFERFEEQWNKFPGNIERAAVALAKEWRLDRGLRNLEALLLVANRDKILVLSGSGEVIEPDDGVAAIGSGGPYALAAARALLYHTDLGAAAVARESLKIAASICLYTNDCITLEEIPAARGD